MPTPSEKEIDEVQDSSDKVDNFIDRLEILVNSHVNEVKKEVDSLTEEAAILAALARLSPELMPRQIIEHINKLEDLYTREARLLSSRFDLSREDELITRGLIEGEKRRLSNNVGDVFTAIASAYILTKIGGIAPKKKGITASGIIARNALADRQKVIGIDVSLPELRDNFIDSALRELNTKTITTLYGFRSGMEIRKASEIDTNPLFLYVGVRDDRNRPFCRKVLDLNKVWTVEEINELDNDPLAQLLPVSIYCGGYNCRHIWRYYDKKRA